MKKLLNKERITAIICFIFGALVYYGASQMKKSALDPVGPGVFPKVASAIIMVISVLHFVISPTTEENTKEKEELHWRNVAILAGMIVVYIFLFPRIGFPIATTAFLFAFSTIFDPRPMKEKIVGNILFSVLFMAVLYLIFKVLLGIMLPSLIIGK